MGADWGIHVTTDMSTDQDLQPLAVAKVFKHFMDIQGLNQSQSKDNNLQLNVPLDKNTLSQIE